MKQRLSKQRTLKAGIHGLSVKLCLVRWSLDKAVDISKDSNYSTLLEDIDGPSTGNVPLDDHIESGDETQVDSQDEICSPQKGFLRLYKTYINAYALQADTA